MGDSAAPVVLAATGAALCALALGVPLPSPAARADRADRSGGALADVPPAIPAPGRIVYTRQHADAFDMFTADPDGANERQLADIDDSAAGEDQPRWSPDGTTLSFATYRDGRAAFHRIDAEGGAVQTLVVREGTSGDAAWSPDGRCLVFNGGRAEDENRFDLKIWCDEPPSGAPDPNVPVGTLRRLTDTPDVDERDPDWSPDGQRIVFVSKSNAPSATDRWRLETIRPDGADRRPLATPPDVHARFPRFDPLGERIGVITQGANLPFGALGVLDVATGAHVPLVELASDAWSWSPDGTELLFANIANAGVRLVDGLALRLGRDATAASRIDAASLPSPARRAAGQQKGLYRIDVASRTVTRLTGPAGGADAPNQPTNFEFGFMPDWTAGTATPPLPPTATPTDAPTPTTTPPPTATATATREATPTAGATATATGRRGTDTVYLPRVWRAAPRRGR